MKKNGDNTKDFFAKLAQLYGRLIGTVDKSQDYSSRDSRFQVKGVDWAVSSKAAIPGHFVIKGFLLAFLFTILILSGLVWYTWRSNQHLKELETRHFRLLELSGQIIHLDEVLTMSANMAVSTFEPGWEIRYRNFEPQLDTAIKEVIALSPEKFMIEAIKQTDAANIKLVDMENQAFDMIRKGQNQAAADLLHSPEYKQQKQVYSAGINEIADAISSREKARIKKEQRIALTIIVLLIVTMPLVAFIWLAALWILRKYIAERKRTELALRTSEQCFSAIADYSYFWEIWVSPAGRVVWSNPAVKRVTGYSVKELMAMPDFPQAFIHEQDSHRMNKALELAREGGIGNEVQFRMIRKDGTVIWAEVSWKPIYDKNDAFVGYRASARDITERKDATKALLESEERYRALVENVDLGITLVDTEHNIVMANAAVGKMFDCDISEFIGKKCYNRFEKRQEICSHCPGEKAMKSGHCEEVETQGVRDDQSRFAVRIRAFPLFDDNGNPTAFIEVVEDITDRKRAQEALHASEEKFRLMFETSPLGMVLCEMDGKFVQANHAYLDIIGYSHEEALKLSYWDVTPREYDALEAEQLQSMKETGRYGPCEKEYIRKTGQRVPVLLNGMVVKGIDGVERIWSIVEDITNRKQAELALRNKEERYRTLVDNIPGVVYRSALDEHWTMHYMSELIEKISGYPASDFIENKVRSFASIIHPEDRQMVKKIVFEQVNKDRSFSLEYRIITSDGNIEWLFERGRSIKDENRNVLYLDGVLFNVTDRKQAEEAMQKSEQRYRALVENIELGIVLVDTDYNIVMANASVGKIFRCGISEIIGTKCYDKFANKQEICVFCPGQKAMKTGQPEDIETERFRDDGSLFVVRIQAFPLFDDNGKSTGFIGLIEDVTRRREAEEQIREIQERFSDFFKNAPIGFHIFGPDQVIIDINDAELEMIGYSRDEILGKKTWADIIIPQQRGMFKKHWHNITTKAHARNLEYTLVHKDGHHVNVIVNASARFDKDGNVINTRGSVLNITARKHAELALKKSRERLSLAFSAANDGLWDWNIKTGQVYFSPRYYTMLGYKPNEFPPSYEAWADLIHPDDRQSTEEKIREHIERKSETFDEICRLKTKSGGWRWILSKGKVVQRGANGEPVRMAGIHSDITVRKEAEQARQKLTQELEAKNKELESILYAASHDLKSPLVNIQGFSYELSQSCEQIRSALTGRGKSVDTGKVVETALNEDIPKSLNYILSSSAKMDSLLSGLLDISRLETVAINVESIDVNAMMAGVVENIEYQITGAGAKVDIQTLPSCLGDITQISRVFTNLLNNALKFLDKSRPGKIRIFARSEDGHSVYCVEDNGIGVAPEHQKKIFDIFYQLEPETNEGEGIGLSIVRSILERHNGKIWLESKAGTGTKFFVSLPNG